MLPLALLSFDAAPSPPQLAGIAIACHAYHSLRHMNRVPMEKLHDTVRSIISADVNLYRLNSLHSRSRQPSSRRDERAPPSLPSRAPRLERIVEDDTNYDIGSHHRDSHVLHAPSEALRSDVESELAPPLDGRVELDVRTARALLGPKCLQKAPNRARSANK